MKNKIMKSLLALLLALLDRLILMRIPSNTNLPASKGSVKFSALMVGIKGKVGGTVFQGSRTGGCIKNKPNGNFVKAIKWIFGVPLTQATWGNAYNTLLDDGNQIIYPDGSNSLTGTNRAPQNLITRLSKSWAQLTNDERAAWNASAPNFPFTNRWGDPYTGSGFQVFMSINNKIMAFGVPMITMPPSPDDGEFGSYDWSSITVAEEATATNLYQVGMNFSVPPKLGGHSHLCKRFNGQWGSTVIIFGGYARGSTIAGTTYELLPSTEMLGLAIKPGGSYFIDISVVNLDNGHTVYRGGYTQKIPVLTVGQLFQWAPSGIYGPSPGLALNPVLEWSTDALVIAFGDIPVDHESELLGYLIRLLQLTANEAITFTVAGTNPNNFVFLLGTTSLSSVSPTVVNANNYGTYGNVPLIVQFQPDSSGAKSCTLTISSTSLTSPVVINLNGTGI